MTLQDANAIANALRLVGELLQARGQRFQIVVIGGAAVNLLGLVSRATTDVDILAFATSTGRTPQLRPPDEPLPEALLDAATTVAQDLNLARDWLNNGPASQWRSGLPPGLAERVHWREYGGLRVGLTDRYDLIFFKLYAAVDETGPESVHFQDLLAFKPSDDELEQAARWVRQQDPTPITSDALNRVIAHARDLRTRPR